MFGSPIVLLLATLAVTFLLVPALIIFLSGPQPRHNAIAIAAAFPASMLLATAEWLLLGADVDVAVFQGAVAATAVSIILAVGLRTGRAPGYLVYCAIWVVVVLVPVGFASFDVVNGLVAAKIGTLDFGGASVIAICTGTAGLAIATMSRARGNAVGGMPRRGRVLLALCAVAGVIGWIALGTGAELVIDPTSAVLVRNELIGATAGMAGWTVTQVINVHRATVAGFVAGLFAGSAVVLASLPWISPLSAVVIGFGAGALGHIAKVAAWRSGAGPWAPLLGALGVPGAVGLLVTGVVGEPLGLIFSGHTDLLVRQFGGFFLIAGYSYLIALSLAVTIDRTLGLVGGSPLVDETIARLYRAYGSGSEDAVRPFVQAGMQWPEGWSNNSAGTPSRTRRLRDGGIQVSFAGSPAVHIYRERDGLFDRCELG